MRVKTSLDWDKVSQPLVAQMHSAPQASRKDLAKMLGAVTGLVQKLANEEVLLRQTRKTSSLRQQELLVQIEDALDNYEKWLMWAHLAHG